MLYTRNELEQIQGWSCGGAQFLHQYEAVGAHRYVVAVRCRLGVQEEEYFAMLDTAADRSIIAPSVAEMLDGDLGEVVGQTTIASRFGTVDAELRQVGITLLADASQGRHIKVRSTCAFPSLWSGPQLVLGFSGFLEQIRFALEPSQIPAGKSMIYFGKTVPAE